MKIIQQKYYKADKVLGQQKRRDGSPWRFLTYCIAVECDDGVLLHNVMTRELLLVEGEECDMLNTADLNSSPVLRQSDSPLFDYLFANWYVVPETHDDKTLCLSLRAVLRHLQEAKLAGKINAFTILTTTDCNARCFYCYERGCKHEDMSNDTAHRVVDFIATHRSGSRVRLSWFGGEPLYNLSPIRIITAGMQERGIMYTSSMISNGYLFDEALVREAREQWHLTSVQISLDGTEEVYNRRKAYIYKGVNAFRRVTDNMELLLRAGVHISVRLNLDTKNYDDLLLLADYLVARYGKYRRFSPYAQYLMNTTCGCPIGGSDIATVDRYRQTLNERLGRKEVRGGLPRYVALYHCMADNPSSVQIQTDGALGKCEHYFNSHACGTLATGLSDSRELALSAAADTYLAACDRCPLYPTCIRLAICPSSFVNSQEPTTALCGDNVAETQQKMLNTYHRAQRAHDERDNNI